MNPNSGREAGPQFEFPPEKEGLERQRERSMESKPAEETSVGKHKAPVQDVQIQAPAKVPSTPVIPDSQTQGLQPTSKTAPTAGLMAHDVDLIEKQWVESAKTIVNQTRDDPYVQKKEMSKVKADYIKKRFNKSIPTDDAAMA